MLIDTGATLTAISADVARELQLPVIDIQRTYGSGGLHELKVHLAHLTISIEDDRGRRSMIEADLRVGAIPQLEELTDHLGVQGELRRLVGLLGRDFLRHTRMVYEGSKGVVSVEIDLPSLTSRAVRSDRVKIPQPAPEA